MRTLDWGMTAVFGFAAFVQWNDPDPFAWIAFYGLAALASLGAALLRVGSVWSILEWAAAGIAAIVVLALAPSLAGARIEAFTSFHMKSSDDEVVRELVGAAVALAWTAGLVVRRRRAPGRGAQP